MAENGIGDSAVVVNARKVFRQRFIPTDNSPYKYSIRNAERSAKGRPLVSLRYDSVYGARRSDEGEIILGWGRLRGRGTDRNNYSFLNILSREQGALQEEADTETHRRKIGQQEGT